MFAQTAVSVAMSKSPVTPLNATTLPDAPSAVFTSAVPEASAAPNAGDQARPPVQPIAGRFVTVILPGQRAVELHGMEKAMYALHDSFSLTEIAGFTISAGWSHLINTTPHYGTDATAFGKREGASALRSTITVMSTDGLFCPIFHDDPRYYAMGYGHTFFNRAFYAASRVVITKSSHSDHHRINAPLLLGYGVTAASNNAYYPNQDRGFKNTAENWGTSLAGSALGFEVDECLGDALRVVRLRRD